MTAGAVERAVRAELRSLKVSVQTDGAAALAVSLAAQIDGARGAVAAAASATQLRLLLADFRAADREKPQRSRIDDLRADELAARRRSAG
jgi:hypothetical protein